MSVALTVIIPAKNEEKFLPTLLDSLKPQLGAKDEIIVNDNLSTDNTSLIAEQYGCKVRIVEDLWAGLNDSVEKACNPIIITVGADCVFPRNHILQVKKLFTEPYIVGVTGPIKDRNRTILGYVVSGLANKLWRGMGFQAFRKSAFIDVGGYKTYKTPLPNVTGKDVEFWTRLTKYGKTIYDESLCTYTDLQTWKARTVPIVAFSGATVGAGYLLKREHSSLGTGLMGFGVGVATGEVGYRVAQGRRLAIVKCTNEECSIETVFHHKTLAFIPLLLSPFVLGLPYEKKLTTQWALGLASFGLGLLVHGLVTQYSDNTV